MWLEYLLSGEGFSKEGQSGSEQERTEVIRYLKVYLLYMGEREAEERKREKQRGGISSAG